jgi:hypothetical protein
MIERGEYLRFSLEARESIGIVGEVIRQNLQRDVSQELRVPRTEDDAHGALAELRGDFIDADA